MLTLDPLALVLGLIGGVLLAGVLLIPRAIRAIPSAPAPPPDPFQQLVQQTGAISGVLKIWQDQLTALAAQMERIESEKRELVERADKLENLNRALGDRLIAQCDHADAIYRSLEQFQEGRGWAAGFRRDDPRYKPPAPPVT